MRTAHQHNGYDPALLEYLEAFEAEFSALEGETSTCNPLYTAWVQHSLTLLENADLAKSPCAATASARLNRA